MRGKKSYEISVDFTLLWLLVFIVLGYVMLSPRGVEMTNHYIDPLRTTPGRSEAVVIGIDDKSLQAIGAWPWNRDIFAKLTDKLNVYGVKGIAYDVLFLEVRAGDAAFQKAVLASQAKIILGVKKQGSGYIPNIFSGRLPITNAITDVDVDTDGKVRHYPGHIHVGGVCLSPLGSSAFALFIPGEKSCAHLENTSFRYSDNITEVSLIDVLQGRVATSTLQNTFAFVGSTALDLEDHFPSLSGNKIPGVYIHASIFTSLLNNVEDTPTSSTASLLLLFVVAGLTTISIYRSKRILVQVALLILIVGGIFLLTSILFDYGFIIPAPWLVIGTLVFAGYTTLHRFIKEKRQNDNIKNIFSRYVHKDVLNDLLKQGGAIDLGGKKEYLTILFSDLRGFTTLSESLSAEKLTETLNGYFSAMSPEILNERGTIDKFIGDAIMAFWNAPLPIPHHETHALLSAVAMMRALKRFNAEHKTHLAIGIGIHAGNVVVGNVGSQERVNYTVLGDAVNTASRLEGLTKKYGVHIITTEEVKAKVNDERIAFRRLDEITVKGKNVPTTIYEVLAGEDYNKDHMARYEQALELYQKGQFKEAQELFLELSKVGDAPSDTMLSRISVLKGDTSWDGVWRFDEK